MMPLKHILKNKLLLQKHFHTQEWAMDNWPFWQFEENIKLVNEIIEDEDKQEMPAPPIDPRDPKNLKSAILEVK